MTKYECDKCHDHGLVYVLGDGVEVPVDQSVPYGTYAKVCDCQEKKRIAQLFRSSHITEEFQRLGFQNFTTDGRPQAVVNAKEAALSYLKHFEESRKSRRNSISLLGVPGTGKTHLLMAVSNNLMRKGFSVHYFPWVEGFGDLKDDLDQLERKIGHMKKVDVLFVDDLFKGRKRPTEFQLEQLFAVVNYRYLNHMPMLVSSERMVDEMCQIDEGIGSRIYEMCKDYTVLMALTKQEEKDGVKLNYRL